MAMQDLTPDERVNLADLQVGSLKLIALFAGVTGYFWLVAAIWLQKAAAPFHAWAPPAGLALCALVSVAWRARLGSWAPVLLMLAVSGAIAYALYDYRAHDIAYLFVLGVIFASVLLGPASTFILAGGYVAVVAALAIWRLGLPILSTELLFPIGVIVLAALGSWLGARNLYIAGQWAWNGYSEARRNELLARGQQSELRQALKALDEATYRLERANQMLALARDQAEEARRLKQQFAQTISHELRTPLNLIVGFTEMMTQSPDYYGGPFPAALARDLSTVHRNSRHLQTLINDVLDLARIEAAQMAILPEETDPAALVEEAVNTARGLVEARGLSLHTEIEPNLPTLWLDPIRIRQVLFNLLNNAARFTEEGGVTLSVRRSGEHVLFAVADTGIGIAQEELPRIFREFEQLDGSTRRRHGGVGLGLAISKQFVELHGGRIWVESELGRGSTFFFSLPTQPPELAAPRETPPAQAPRAAAPRWQKERILLVVTRSPSAATLLTRYLRGYRVTIVPDVAQARRVAADLLPQAVLIDRAAGDLEHADLEALADSWGLSRASFMVCPLPGEEPLRRRLEVDSYLIKPISRVGLWDALRPFGDAIDRVLVIDDDRDFVRLIRQMLDSPVRHYQVTGAYTGHEGLDKMRRLRPDLLLLDLVLPDISGLQVIEQVRANPAWQRLPIVVISGEEEIDGLEALRGTVHYARSGGLRPGEVVQWVQHVLDANQS